jgi:hypothetical protein
MFLLLFNLLTLLLFPLHLTRLSLSQLKYARVRENKSGKVYILGESRLDAVFKVRTYKESIFLLRCVRLYYTLTYTLTHTHTLPHTLHVG